ncbi:GNAT family N-acetyltransferase [Maridesulfovibrio sp.]|uniref:GNAT family N-acetyltransferase n=1 Tax=Maridesulfovibrio sp. TaxID=2795000 RepID=UPI0029C9C1AB|nr:GNAT family N-acetyltransferase [Maridesulfovibrio sp.]
MSESIIYDQLQPGEEYQASELIFKVFDEKVAPGFTAQGRSEFKVYATPQALRERMEQGAVVFTARHAGRIVGVAEIRFFRHLGMLFVDSAEQGNGIGKILMSLVIEHCRKAGTSELTVNSSPNSRTFYLGCGFTVEGEEQNMNGIRFVPLKFVL